MHQDRNTEAFLYFAFVKMCLVHLEIGTRILCFAAKFHSHCLLLCWYIVWPKAQYHAFSKYAVAKQYWWKGQYLWWTGILSQAKVFHRWLWECEKMAVVRIKDSLWVVLWVCEHDYFILLQITMVAHVNQTQYVHNYELTSYALHFSVW